MMGAGGFIKNPGWDMYSDDLVEGDGVFFEVNSDVDVDPELLVYFPPWSDEDLDETDEEFDDQEDLDDPDYEYSDTGDEFDEEGLDNSMEEDDVDSDDDDDQDGIGDVQESPTEVFKGLGNMAEESDND